jgi:hypothetical protein
MAARFQVYVKISANGFTPRLSKGMYFRMGSSGTAMVSLAHNPAVLYYYRPHQRIGAGFTQCPGGQGDGQTHVSFCGSCGKVVSQEK